MKKNCETVRIGGVDRKATDIYNEYFNTVSKAAASTGLARDLCDDVAIEVLASLFRNPEKYDPSRASLGTYLSTMARSRAVDFFRKRRGDRLFCVEDEALAILDERSAIHDSLSEYTPEDACLLLTETVRRLSLKDGNRTRLKVFAMYILAEMPRSEIAEQEHVTPDYVSLAKTRLYNAFIAHLECIKHEDEEGRLLLSTNDISYLEEYIPSPEGLA